jgi:sirohydrochlorin cobaltochelatase
MNDTTWLLVGHGSRGPQGNQEALDFVAQWRAHHPDWRIETCFIEHAEVLLADGLEHAATHSRRVRLLPLILNAAGHVKDDLPEAVAAARSQHPGTTFEIAPPLGMGSTVQQILTTRLAKLMHTLAMPDPKTTGVILLGRGSSDATANGELASLARRLFEAHHHELIDLAFTGIAWPRLESVVQRQLKLGMTQICIQPVYLFSGVLTERIAEQCQRLRKLHPQISFALGQHFGAEPSLFELLDERAQQPLPPFKLTEESP